VRRSQRLTCVAELLLTARIAGGSVGRPSSSCVHGRARRGLSGHVDKGCGDRALRNRTIRDTTLRGIPLSSLKAERARPTHPPARLEQLIVATG